MKKQGTPQRSELVVCRIDKLYPNSASVRLLEYEGKRGIVHVAEVALRWVTDIREFVKEGQFVVCRVMGAEGGLLSLSIKRVRKSEAASKLNEFNRERKSEKVLEMVAKSLNKNLDDAYKECGHLLIEEFGSLTKGLDTARKKPQLLAEKSVPKKWVEAIAGLLEKSEESKTYTYKVNLSLTSYAPDGVEQIKGAFKKHASGLTAKYLSAPKYTLEAHGSDRKKLEAQVSEAAQAIARDVQKSGTASFEPVKK